MLLVTRKELNWGSQSSSLNENPESCNFFLQFFKKKNKISYEENSVKEIVLNLEEFFSFFLLELLDKFTSR